MKLWVTCTPWYRSVMCWRISEKAAGFATLVVAALLNAAAAVLVIN
jgi:hypothetical protein